MQRGTHATIIRGNKLEVQRHKFQRRLPDISWKDEVKNEGIRKWTESDKLGGRYDHRTKVKMARACVTDAEDQHTY